MLIPLPCESQIELAAEIFLISNPYAGFFSGMNSTTRFIETSNNVTDILCNSLPGVWISYGLGDYLFDRIL